MKIIKSIGLMSGTSADGLSIAYCNINLSERKINLKAFHTYPYSKTIQNKILSARELPLSEIVKLHFELGRLWNSMLLDFVRKNHIKKIDVISSHGQTVYHSSKDRLTCQIGEPSFFSKSFKCPVVYDFRVNDIIYGGEGAPLVPVLDEFLFGHKKNAVGLLNIGGIANISVVGKGIKTYGFDTGPGNTLMDWAVRIYSVGKKSYDKNGLIASKGKVDYMKLKDLLKNKYFMKKPPKSLDREEFGKEFLLQNFNFKMEKIEDILATLNFFTAKTVEYSVRKFIKHRISEIIISGGGAYNKTLLKNLSLLLPDIKISFISDYGINDLAKESVAFALMGAMRINNIPANCPSVTGASRKVLLGKIV